MTLIELENIKANEKITYSDLLTCKEWKSKRIEILDRDNHKCTKCEKVATVKLWSGNHIIHVKIDRDAVKNGKELTSSKNSENLEVHHKYYIMNQYPWEYNNEALVSVCRECHQDIHNNTKIDVWDEEMINKLEFGGCSRCSGRGYLSEYNHVQGGQCFNCGGSGQNVPFEYKKT